MSRLAVFMHQLTHQLAGSDKESPKRTIWKFVTPILLLVALIHLNEGRGDCSAPGQEHRNIRVEELLQCPILILVHPASPTSPRLITPFPHTPAGNGPRKAGKIV